MKQKIMKRFRDLTRAGVISIIVLLTAVLPLTAMSEDSVEGTQKPAAAASAQQDQEDSVEGTQKPAAAASAQQDQEDSVEGTQKPVADASAQQDQAAELAKKAQNPVADMMIMPLQYNIDFGIGPADATQQYAEIHAGPSLFPGPGLEPDRPHHHTLDLRGVAGARRR